MKNANGSEPETWACGNNIYIAIFVFLFKSVYLFIYIEYKIYIVDWPKQKSELCVTILAVTFFWKDYGEN